VLVAGRPAGRLDCGASFWIKPPVGVLRHPVCIPKLRDNGGRRARISTGGQITLRARPRPLLVGRHLRSPSYGNNSHGWISPVVLGEIICSSSHADIFLGHRDKVRRSECSGFRCSRSREFHRGHVRAGCFDPARRHPFILIICLQGIWLPSARLLLLPSFPLLAGNLPAADDRRGSSSPVRPSASFLPLGSRGIASAGCLSRRRSSR